MKWIPVFLSAALFAGDPCCEPNCCPSGALDAPSCSGKQYEGRYGTLFSATPCTPCSVVWIADVSLLAWQAIEEGLNFALKNDPLPVTADVNVNGDLIGIDFDWEPAVKINLGAWFVDPAWDAQIRWTYFHTDSSSRSSTNLFPLWAFPSANIASQFIYGSAHGSLELNLNEFDIEMGYHPFLSPALSIRFIAGLKVVTIDQDFNVKYSDGFNDGVNQLGSAHAALTNKAIGTGPRIGFDSKWRVGAGFSLLGSIAGSLPLWHYRVTRTDTDLGVAAGTPRAIDAFFKERFWTFRSILETSLGLGWDTCFGCRQQYPFGASASYEFQYFAEQNMMAMLVNPGILTQVFHSRGDLHLHGATLTFHFGF